ncbi:MAG: bifunctional phosphopantothenoylcysteine decarboxylase/phosphopantothenate--cysteine ligase CoaBC [Synergistaceae bacterium]|nr:bifunctional phosphopantothenoylcysteine decarboxylase/phosphopantothenate--cysteine ligase CoaBC [Synergistaceae bacterium]
MRVLLGITGGIAAYKIPFLVRLLKKAGCELEIVLTDSAAKFVSPLALASLNHKRVWRDADLLDDNKGFEIPHINLANWPDVIAVAPCTANSIAKFAHGHADNLLSSVILASGFIDMPVLIFPAMNANMLDNAATQENIEILRERGAYIIEPEAGFLACGAEGKGRMPEPDEIFEEVMRAAVEDHDLLGCNVLVTAGPTREFLDPARFISNPSSGKMGIAVARTAWRRGADVKLILGPVTPPQGDYSLYGFEVIKVSSAQEMLKAVIENLDWAKFIIKAAAVGDYKAKEFQEHKIKREKQDDIVIELAKNPDIAAEVGIRKLRSQILVGFAAETDDLINNAKLKLERKNLDYIMANDILAEHGGFESDLNNIKLISRSYDDIVELDGTKFEVADKMWDVLVSDKL